MHRNYPHDFLKSLNSHMPRVQTGKHKSRASGRLRIGDDWNAITIIALSQSNPLKAVAEFVENSIDAGARHVTITRGRERGEHYLMVADDGDGIPRDDRGSRISVTWPPTSAIP